jgi:hypothetical protein
MLFRISTALAASVLLFVSVEAVEAQQIRLNREGQNGVIVWISSTHAREGNVLRSANVDVSLIIPLISCIVPPQTLAVMLSDRGYFKTIMVVDGKNKGCRGVISAGDIGK